MDDYTILGCDRNDPIESIRAKYKKLILKYHPDKYSGSSEKFIEINRAFENIEKDRSIALNFRQTARNALFTFLMLIKPKNVVLNTRIHIKDIYNGVTKKIRYRRFKGRTNVVDEVFIDLHNFEAQYIFEGFGDENPISHSFGDLYVNLTVDYGNFKHCRIDDIVGDYNITMALNIDLHEYFTGLKSHDSAFFCNLPELKKHIPHNDGMSVSIEKKGLPFIDDADQVDRGTLTVLLYLNLSNIPISITKDAKFCEFLRKYFNIDMQLEERDSGLPNARVAESDSRIPLVSDLVV